jgi:hypothetical protein
MQDIMRRAYKAAESMESIAIVGDYVKINTYQATHYRQVAWYEALPPFQWINLGALTAQQLSNRTNITNLDLVDEEFGQWRWVPIDNAQIRLYLPNGVAKWQLKNIQVGLDKAISLRDPTLASTEFCSWEDERPAMEGLNFSDYALGACRIVGFGYRFHTEEIPEFIIQNNGAKVPNPILAGVKNGTIPCTPVDCAGRV